MKELAKRLGGKLLRSVEPQSALEDRFEAEIAERIFEVGVQPLHRAHLGIRDIFHGQRNPLFTFSKRRDRVPELVTVENHHVAGFSDQLKMAWLFGRVVLEKLTYQLALG